MSMKFVHELPTPEEVKQKYPISAAAAATKAAHDAELAKIFKGESEKNNYVVLYPSVMEALQNYFYNKLL